MGPVEASTSMALEQWPSTVWDTNGFYHDMGLHFRATRSAIRRAYQDLGGSGNVRLTMIAGVLLNPKRRLAYDLTPLGRLFFDDEIEEAIRIAAATSAGATRAEGGEVDSDLLNKQIDEMREPVDYMNDSPAYSDRYPWSYYLHASDSIDTALLDQWRSAIIDALWSVFPLDKPSTVVVGFMGSTEDDIRVAENGFRVVSWVNDQLSFSRTTAFGIATLIVHHQHTNHKHQGESRCQHSEVAKLPRSPQARSLERPSSA
jgi:hypothetical protein